MSDRLSPLLYITGLKKNSSNRYHHDFMLTIKIDKLQFE